MTGSIGEFRWLVISGLWCAKGPVTPRQDQSGLVGLVVTAASDHKSVFMLVV